MLHIRPWETRTLLTVDDFDQLEQYLIDRDAAIRKAAANNGRT